VNNLTAVASNDDIANNYNLQSRVSFNAVATTQYHVAIDGYNGASGDTTLNWSPTGSILLQVPRPLPAPSKKLALRASVPL